jgi:hypothetical protein
MTNLKNTPKNGAIVTAAESSTARKTKPVGPAAKAAAKPESKALAKSTPKVSARPASAKSAAEVKPKLVRDSFTIPKAEYAVLDALKLRAAKLERPIKKGELLRAGIGALNAMGDKAFLAALGAVPSLKTGRPKRAVDNGSD